MEKNLVARTLAGAVIGVVAVGALSIGAAYAQQPAARRGQMMMNARGAAARRPLAAMRRALAQLGLSDEQRQQVRSIVQGRQVEMKTFRDQMRQARRAVRASIGNDEGEAAIRARSAELAKVEADLAVFRAELRKQIFGVLTPEQQAKARELRLKAQKRRQELAGGR